ncbi:MAG: DUF58 domain-containing protein [Clostridia bacterium]|nr:DUF58 domain-containing protein [Clostridia bacterium]
MNILVILILFFLLAFLYGLLLRHIALRGLVLHRKFSVSTAYAGETAEMVETVINDRPLVIPWLRVESKISPDLRFGKRDDLEVVGDMYHRSLFTVMPYQRIVRRHRVKFLRRGVYNVGSAALTAGDITGMFQETREQQLDMHVTVYPHLLDERELPPPVLEMTGEWTRQRQLLDDPFLVRGIREYRAGDRVRDIHWAATARTGQMQVMMHEYAAMNRVMVLLNSQLRADQWENLMDYEQMEIEHLISLTATVCMHALRAGMEVGFAGNLPLTGADARISAEIPPMSGSAQEEHLLDTMAHLKIQRTVRFPTFLESFVPPENARIVLVTHYLDEEIRLWIRDKRSRGITVQVIGEAEV